MMKGTGQRAVCLVGELLACLAIADPPEPWRVKGGTANGAEAARRGSATCPLTR